MDTLVRRFLPAIAAIRERMEVRLPEAGTALTVKRLKNRRGVGMRD